MGLTLLLCNRKYFIWIYPYSKKESFTSLLDLNKGIQITPRVNLIVILELK